VARSGMSYGEGVLGFSEQAVAESVSGSGQSLVSSLILQAHPGGHPVTREPFREHISSRRPASAGVAGSRVAAEPTDTYDEVEISPATESICAMSTPTSDHTVLGYLFRIGGLQGLLLTLLYLHLSGLGIDIRRLSCATSRSSIHPRGNSSKLP
jgi:hypothetical protein